MDDIFSSLLRSFFHLGAETLHSIQLCHQCQIAVRNLLSADCSLANTRIFEFKLFLLVSLQNINPIIFLKEVFSTWFLESLFFRAGLPFCLQGFFAGNHAMGSIPGLTPAHAKVPLKICWSVSCGTWQLPDCTWLVFFPHLHWTLVHSPFRLPKSSSFSYGSRRNPRSASAVASLSPPHQENRIE